MTNDEVGPGGRGTRAIRETETELTLTLAAARNIHWGRVFQNASMLLFALLVVWMAQTKHAEWGFWIMVAVGIWTLFNVLYPLLGTDIIEASRDFIIVKVGIGPLKRTHKYKAERISDLRCTDSYYLRPVNFGPRTRTVWETVLDPHTSMIICDYNGQETPLVSSIDKTLARHFVSQVKQRFPNYKGK